MIEEKGNVGLRHLLPVVMVEHGLAPAQLKIPQSVMEQIVTGYTRDAGVRNLERHLATICRKEARRIIEKPETHLRLTRITLEQYLGLLLYHQVLKVQNTRSGVQMDLAMTES